MNENREDGTRCMHACPVKNDYHILQTNESMFAILDGEIMDKSEVFVDSLLKDPAVAEDRRPLVADLIMLSIGQGG